jgi:hypothetical protein
MNLRGLSLTVAVLVTLTLGCQQTRELGRSTKQLFTGTTEATVDRTPEQVVQAIDATIADLKLLHIGATTKPGKTATETTVVIRNAADQRITVMYHPVSETKTRVVVGTGAFGDSELRQNVWDNLRLRLGVLGSSAVSTSAQPTTQP